MDVDMCILAWYIFSRHAISGKDKIRPLYEGFCNCQTFQDIVFLSAYKKWGVCLLKYILEGHSIQWCQSKVYLLRSLPTTLWENESIFMTKGLPIKWLIHYVIPQKYFWSKIQLKSCSISFWRRTSDIISADNLQILWYCSDILELQI